MAMPRAKQDAERVWRQNGSEGARVEVLPAQPPQHACPKCDTPVPCMWETIARVEQQATALRMIAAKLRNKQLGLPIGGPPRKNVDWTDEDIFEAYRSGMSIRAIARLYSAATATVDRAIKRVAHGGEK